jgi:tetratricopeptide (TPR) repeat protein
MTCLAISCYLTAQEQPNPAASSWIGRRVLLKEFFKGFEPKEEPQDKEELKKHSGSPLQLMCSITVIDEKGDDIRVRAIDDVAWVKKSDVVHLNEAEDYYGRRLAAKPKEAENHALMAVLFVVRSDLDQALKSIDQAVALSPEMRTYRIFKLGILYEQKTKPKEALALADELIKSNPNDLVPQGMRCGLLLLLERYQDALGNVELYLTKKPDNLWAKCIRGICLLELKKETEGVRVLESLLEDCPEFLYATQALIHHYMDRSENTKAISLLKKGLDLYPDDPELLLRGGYLYLFDQQPKNAITCCTKLIDQSKTPDPKAFLYRGIAHLKQGDEKKAMADVTVYLESKPTEPNAYVTGYHLYSKNGKHMAALKCLDRIGELDPKHAHLKMLKAATLWDMEDLHGANELMKDLLTKGNLQDQAFGAYFLATNANEKYRDGKTALAKFEEISKRYDVTQAEDFNIMHAAAEAACGQFAEAAARLKRFLVEPARSKLDQSTIERLKSDIELYEAKKPKRLAKSER